MARAFRFALVLALFSATYAFESLAGHRPQAIRVSAGNYDVRLENGLVAIAIPGGFTAAPVGEPDLPQLSIFLDGLQYGRAGELKLIVLQADTVVLPGLPIPVQAPVRTSDSGQAVAPIASDEIDYNNPVYPTISHRFSVASWRGRRVYVLTWTPFRYYPATNRLVVIREAEFRESAELTSGAATRPSIAADIESFRDTREYFLRQIPTPVLNRTTGSGQPQTIHVGTPTDVEYVIITNNVLAPAVRPLAEWRQRTGYRTGIALIDDIAAAYPGEDLPAQIRAYLSEAYAGGLEFCVLGGDETVVPIRYAYHGYSDTTPDVGQLQICDLYYGDLTGTWDVDGDGIYGEYLEDSADVFPEIYVGRLLARDTTQAKAVVGKILAYEANPGNGDPSYLTRSLLSCADQMRDWDGAQGQHAIIAGRFPADFVLDLDNQSENPLGSLPDPAYPEGEAFVTSFGSGWGWATLINHGRADGFILRAANLNEWPKSYVWSTGHNGDGHGHLNLLAANSTPGIVLSVACALGGFDMDGPLFNGFYGPTICENLIQKPDGGAVAMIAYSRWGWVASSYKIVDKFFDYIFDPGVPPQIGVSFALAKCNYPYYRDQNFGLNLYGDPAMQPWTALPRNMDVDFPEQVPANSGSVTFMVMQDGVPLAGALVTAAYADTVFFAAETDGSGVAVWESGPERLGGYSITVSKTGFLPAQGKLIAPIVTDVFDENQTDDTRVYTLAQNHPNPFNVATIIEFSVPTMQDVRLDVYNILGRRVATLVDGLLSPGQHSVEFAARSEDGAPLASGVYFYRLQAGTKAEIKKMLLLK
jgi:hypothetical protein